ncbi:MAG TPA: DUF1801 domain-containing protein [Ktedonobacterales bacterium]
MSATDEIEEFLALYPPEIVAIRRALRAVVQDVASGGHEELFARHNHWSYGPTPKYSGREVYICPLTRYVRLGFFHGVGLPDPAGLIEGEGKRLRHVKVWTVEQARGPEVRALVAAAWANVVERGKD